MDQNRLQQLAQRVEEPEGGTGTREDLINDILQDIAEVTAKDTIEDFEDEFKGGEVKHTHTEKNTAKDPLHWIQGLAGNILGATEDQLEEKVIKTAQQAFDKQIDRNGELINPSEESLHPNPKDRKEPQMPDESWTAMNPVIKFPTEATGIFAQPGNSGNSNVPGFAPKGGRRGITNFIQTSSGENSESKAVPDAVKDVWNDVFEDLKDLGQERVYEKTKEAWTKDYAAVAAAKRDALNDAKGPIDWIKNLGQAKKAEVVDRWRSEAKETAKEQAQRIWDKQVSDDGKIQGGTVTDILSKTLGTSKSKDEEDAAEEAQ